MAKVVSRAKNGDFTSKRGNDARGGGKRKCQEANRSSGIGSSQRHLLERQRVGGSSRNAVTSEKRENWEEKKELGTRSSFIEEERCANVAANNPNVARIIREPSSPLWGKSAEGTLQEGTAILPSPLWTGAR